MKKIIPLLLAALLLSLAACGNTGPVPGYAQNDGPPYSIGIVQLTKHDALDKATKGFMDTLKDEFGEENVVFDLQIASGDSDSCAEIAEGFVSDGVDMIMANSTIALLAAADATDTIPIIGTSVTSYNDALKLDYFEGIVGGNITGTSGQAPLSEQAAMIWQICPDAESVAILYSEDEPNSAYQARVVGKYLKDHGLEVVEKTFTGPDDVADVTASACEAADVIYLPTDNKAAVCAESIREVVMKHKTRVIAGEENLMSVCGIATISSDYYNTGVAAGKMAVMILTGEVNIQDMAIEYDPHPMKEYNPDMCQYLGIPAPDDYIAYRG